MYYLRYFEMISMRRGFIIGLLFTQIHSNWTIGPRFIDLNDRYQGR